MPAQSKKRREAASRVAGVHRRDPNSPRLPGLRRDLRAAELEEHVQRIVDAFPPLTDEQRDRLAALLRPVVS
jgi:hypothetical protein